MSLRVCLLDGALTGVGAGETAESGASCSDCCKKDKSCCSELKKLPDLSIRSGDAELPDCVATALPPSVFRVAPAVPMTPRVFAPAMAIRGPDFPARRRPLLAVWII